VIYHRITLFILALIFSFSCNSQIISDRGIYIRQLVVNDSIARLSVTTTVKNPGQQKRSLMIRCGIWDHREFLTRDIRKVELQAGETTNVNQPLGFGMPLLWNGPGHPFLYKMVIDVMENGKILETRNIPLGLRKFGFDSTGRFILNGKAFPLFGVVVTFNPDFFAHSSWYQQLKLQLLNICLSGANFILLQRKLQTDSVYSLCDTLGLIVWGNYDISADNKDPERVIDFIHTNYNHPCIFFWSSGDWNFTAKGKFIQQDTIGEEQIKNFTELVIKEDPGRLAFHENDVWWIPYDSIDTKMDPDRLFWYKAKWSKAPFIYISGKTDTINRDSIRKIVIYCNLDEPVLEVNGIIHNERDEGSSEIEFIWKNVILKNGINKIRAFARKKGVRTEDTWTFVVK
jgi:hypothetical protein